MSSDHSALPASDAGNVATGPLRLLIADESELVVHGVENMLLPFRDRVRIIDQVEHEDRAAELVLHDSFAVTPDHFDEDKALARTGALVVYTWQLHPTLVRLALARGVRGCLSKQLSGAELVGALVRIRRGVVVVLGHGDSSWQHDGQSRLAPREAEVLALIARGLTNAEVAEEMCVSVNSVKSYIRSSYRKIDVDSRTQAVLWAIRHGYAAAALPVLLSPVPMTSPINAPPKGSDAEASA